MYGIQGLPTCLRRALVSLSAPCYISFSTGFEMVISFSLTASVEHRPGYIYSIFYTRNRVRIKQETGDRDWQESLLVSSFFFSSIYIHIYDAWNIGKIFQRFKTIETRVDYVVSFPRVFTRGVRFSKLSLPLSLGRFPSERHPRWQWNDYWVRGKWEGWRDPLEKIAACNLLGATFRDYRHSPRISRGKNVKRKLSTRTVP